MREKLNVGVVMGGRSVEHDVSILTGLQVTKALDPDRYEPVPIYITRSGEWCTGKALLDIYTYADFDLRLFGVKRAVIPPDRSIGGLIVPIESGVLRRTRVIHLDVVFPAMHGTHGEDGTLQGLLEMADIPYVGCGVAASAIGMSKLLTKRVLRESGLPVLSCRVINKWSWKEDPNKAVAEAKGDMSYPLFVKPDSLGSSIGVTRVENDAQLNSAVEVAFAYDEVVILESAVRDSIEVNCAVIGSANEILASACEQPLSTSKFLTYEDKYMRGEAIQGMKGADRKIPAPISESMTSRIQETAKQALQAIGGVGFARVDFFVDEETGRILVNELNTMPGSISFYLWEPLGIGATQLVTRLIDIALDIHAKKQRKIFQYDLGLLERAATSGLKLGSKGPLGTTESD
jgi:D-alanine-D-alanine ligase